MSRMIVPEGYRPSLSLYETQTAIGMLKRTFEDMLSNALNLCRVTAPLFVDPLTGLNDNLNGVERPVSFDIPAAGIDAEVVHSLAKWKRMALYRYRFPSGKGIYTDMNAIRRDEELDNLHSVYVDQWDWEKVIDVTDRTEEYLRNTVKSIVAAVCGTLAEVKKEYPQIRVSLNDDVTFISSQELLDMFPGTTPKEREFKAVRKYGTVFISQIGAPLSDGRPHDGRAPDYDDWSLNGDIVFYNEILDCPFEVSSMGIRVDPDSLDRQLSAAGCDERRALEYHRLLLDGTLPQTIGGGIGQSRLSMLLLGKAHVGEVQSSVWDEDTRAECARAGIVLL